MRIGEGYKPSSVCIAMFRFVAFLGDIKEYFGESIALYFAFLEYYTFALVVPSVLGLFGYIFTETVPFFCIFNVIWVTVFLEVSEQGF